MGGSNPSQGGQGGSGLGGAIASVDGTLTLVHVTLVNNDAIAGEGGRGQQNGVAGDATGFAVYVGEDAGTAELDVHNSILHGGIGAVALSVAQGSVAGSNNLVESEDGAAAVVAMSDAPELEELKFHVNTYIRAPLATSPARNAGNPNAPNAPATDARGFLRSSTPDLGAAEYRANEAPAIVFPLALHANYRVLFLAGTESEFSVSDPDADDWPLELTLSVNGGTFTLSETAGLEFVDGDGTADELLVVRGSQADLNAALDGSHLDYAAAENVTIQLILDDLGHLGDGGPLQALRSSGGVWLPNQAPRIVAPVPTISIAYPGEQTFSEGTIPIRFEDPDYVPGHEVLVTMEVIDGTVEFATLDNVDLEELDDEHYELRGTLEAINAAFDGLVYTASAEAIGRIEISFDDQSPGPDGPLVATHTIRIRAGDPDSDGCATTVGHGTSWLIPSLALLALMLLLVGARRLLPARPAFPATATAFLLLLLPVGFAQLVEAQEIAIVYQDQSANDFASELRDDLLATTSFDIDLFDLAQQPPPSFETLLDYQAVLVYWVSAPNEQVREDLGDTLADYVDAGGGLVLCVGTHLANGLLAGRFDDEGYHPLQPSTWAMYPTQVEIDLPATQPNHPVLDNVTAFRLVEINGFWVGYFGDLADGAEEIASYNNGDVLLAERELNGTIIAINSQAPNDDYGLTYSWDYTTDGIAMIGNSLEYVLAVFDLRVNTGITVDEGASVVVTPEMLQATELGTDPDQIVFTLQTTPTNGVLEFDGVALLASDTFTQQDINEGLLVYVHNGSETTVDQFDIEVTNGVDIIADTVFVEVEPVNDPPVLTLPPDQQLDIGDRSIIFSEEEERAISVDDPDAGGGEMVMTLHVTAGTVEVLEPGSVAIVGDNPSNAMELWGTLADLNATLAAGVEVHSPDQFSGDIYLAVLVDDRGNTGKGGPQVDYGAVVITFDSADVDEGSGGCAIQSPAAKGHLTLILLLLCLLTLCLAARRRSG